MNRQLQRIFVAGHRGMVGSAIARALSTRDDVELVCRTHADLDLTDQHEVRYFFATERISQVYLAAARVGGIHANDTYPAEFIQQNLMIAANVIHEAWNGGVQRLLFLGSSCIYPKLAPQPIRESALLSGALEPTNAPYAIAKIAGMMLCESYNRQYGADYRCVMPTNLYGPGDNYHPENSHVIPALIRRFHEAKLTNAPDVTIWGSGTPMREFLYADDLARACVHVMNLPSQTYRQHVGAAGFLNVGTDEEVSIRDLALLVAKVVGFEGSIRFDTSRPDGTPRKRLDSSVINGTGWRPLVALESGLQIAYQDAMSSGRLSRDIKPHAVETHA
ncbi:MULTISPECIES: GDP-L-fucose synthase family protein [Cupriavidus]|uniref:GDP-L-fucose synthase n=1 Tax=Cupriavidus pauculus TaxID=82633 RepID=A0A3G8H781_9BURK|nr:GDP-L-fucose synthase [Cupriavidus pauculus]AZG16089.1 GDP-L-fucose synthase [Cupriavidus pauculus]